MKYLSTLNQIIAGFALLFSGFSFYRLCYYTGDFNHGMSFHQIDGLLPYSIIGALVSIFFALNSNWVTWKNRWIQFIISVLLILVTAALIYSHNISFVMA